VTDQLPYEIPASWAWVRLRDLGLFKKGPFGSSITKETFVPNTYPNRIKVYEQKNAIKKDWTLGKYFITPEKFKELSGFEVDGGDIIVSCAGTIGEIYTLPSEAEKGVINQALMRIKLYDASLQEYFLCYFDFVLKREASNKGSGTGMKNIPPFDVLKQMLVPLPPLAEEKRIINHLNLLLAKTQEISSSFGKIQQYSFEIKTKILNEYFEINASDKSYYGKRTKITLGKLVPCEKIGDGDWVLSENMDENGTIRLIQLKHIGFGEFLNKPFAKVNEQFFLSKNCSKILSGDLLIDRLVSDQMDCCILPRLSFEAITSVDVCWIRADQAYNSKYLMYYFLSPEFQGQVLNACSGSTRKRISKTNLINIPLFIHGRAVQDRVVNEIEKLFSQIDLLSA
jgi:type I restriction enzyme S subunit